MLRYSSACASTKNNTSPIAYGCPLGHSEKTNALHLQSQNLEGNNHDSITAKRHITGTHIRPLLLLTTPNLSPSNQKIDKIKFKKNPKSSASIAYNQRDP
jgi:hypothetical protein